MHTSLSVGDVVLVNNSLVWSRGFVSGIMSYLPGSVGRVTDVDPGKDLDIEVDGWWMEHRHVTPISKEDLGTKSIMYLLTVGRLDTDQVSIIGYYAERPLQTSEESLGVNSGGPHFTALAAALGISPGVLQTKCCVRLYNNGASIVTQHPIEVLPTQIQGEEFAVLGRVRLIGILEGSPYLVSNSYCTSEED